MLVAIIIIHHKKMTSNHLAIFPSGDIYWALPKPLC